MLSNSINKSMPTFPKFIIDYSKKGKKFGGQVSRCPHGGIYEKNINNQKYTILFKQGRNDGETICEFLAKAIYELVIPGYAANIFFSKYNDVTLTKNMKKNDLHYNIYIGSVFFEDFFEIHKIMGYKERPRFLNTFHSKDSKHFVNVFKNSNLGRILATSLWVGDYDVHIANIGTSTEKNRYHFVKIDHGWSFAQFQDRMNYKSVPWSGFSALGRPTNHYKDYDHFGLYNNPEGEFQKTIRFLKHIGPEQIKSALSKAYSEVPIYYAENANKSVAKWIGFPSSHIPSANNLIDYLTYKLYKRATSPLV
ncbi:hypothetical protein [Fluviispira multicolorata]|uniref:LepB N-terminal domain-containing protein n=1 Tax=Fluviispira multicolorata TaxID=2654512 RepID=A0A833JEM8_9BACT|nr:hypothetical protein [Fluviispira multicolorata]KAB8031984.1 hypothetical protein GCL57_04880 [Fluviispira multicolorata]